MGGRVWQGWGQVPTRRGGRAGQSQWAGAPPALPVHTPHLAGPLTSVLVATGSDGFFPASWCAASWRQICQPWGASRWGCALCSHEAPGSKLGDAALSDGAPRELCAGEGSGCVCVCWGTPLARLGTGRSEGLLRHSWAWPESVPCDTPPRRAGQGWQ